MNSLKEIGKKTKRHLVALWLVLKAPETSLLTKVLAIVTVSYGLSPIDLIPDFIPFIGYLDDLLVLPILIMLTIKTIDKKRYEHCFQVAEDTKLENKWYYAIPIVAIWTIFILLIIGKVKGH